MICFRSFWQKLNLYHSFLRSTVELRKIYWIFMQMWTDIMSSEFSLCSLKLQSCLRVLYNLWLLCLLFIFFSFFNFVAIIDQEQNGPCQFTYTDFSSSWSKLVDCQIEIWDNVFAYHRLHRHLACSCHCTSSMSALTCWTILAEDGAFLNVHYIASHTRVIAL